MKVPQYVTAGEVKRVCRELGIKDWTKIKEPKVAAKEARVILDIANVTNSHPILTGMIVLAYMKETLDYYQRLDVSEIEGDLLKAVLSKKLDKIEAKYKKLVTAQAALNKVVSSQLK